MTALYEKLRPKSLDDFIGFPDQIARLNALREACGWNGQVFWITGLSGTGKTTLARIIASEVASPIDTEEIDAQDLHVEKIREIEKQSHYYPMGGESYAYIINEAHNLGTKSVSRLQTALEHPQVQKNVTMIFTTTNKGQQHLFDSRMDSFPFLSRAIMIDLEPDAETLKQMVHFLSNTAKSLSLDGQPLKAYGNLLSGCRGNLRMALQKIASGEMKK